LGKKQEPISKIITGIAHMVEHLPLKHKVPRSNPNTAPKINKYPPWFFLTLGNHELPSVPMVSAVLEWTFLNPKNLPSQKERGKLDLLLLVHLE
jgi:hypothetical protein